MMRGSRKRYRPLDIIETKEISVNQMVDISLLDDEYSYLLSWPDSALTHLLKETLASQAVSNTHIFINCNLMSSGDFKNIELPQTRDVISVVNNKRQLNTDEEDMFALVEPFTLKDNRAVCVSSNNQHIKVTYNCEQYTDENELIKKVDAISECTKEDVIFSFSEMQWDEVMSNRILASVIDGKVCHSFQIKEEEYIQQKAESANHKQLELSVKVKEKQYMQETKGSQRKSNITRRTLESIIIYWELQAHIWAAQFTHALTRLIPLAGVVECCFPLEQEDIVNTNNIIKLLKEFTLYHHLELQTILECASELNHTKESKLFERDCWLSELYKLWLRWRLGLQNAEMENSEFFLNKCNNKEAHLTITRNKHLQESDESNRKYLNENCGSEVDYYWNANVNVNVKNSETFSELYKLEGAKCFCCEILTSIQAIGYSINILRKRIVNHLWGEPLLSTALASSKEDSYFLNTNTTVDHRPKHLHGKSYEPEREHLQKIVERTNAKQLEKNRSVLPINNYNLVIIKKEEDEVVKCEKKEKDKYECCDNVNRIESSSSSSSSSMISSHIPVHRQNTSNTVNKKNVITEKEEMNVDKLLQEILTHKEYSTISTSSFPSLQQSKNSNCDSDRITITPKREIFLPEDREVKLWTEHFLQTNIIEGNLEDEDNNTNPHSYENYKRSDNDKEDLKEQWTSLENHYNCTILTHPSFTTLEIVAQEVEKDILSRLNQRDLIVDIQN